MNAVILDAGESKRLRPHSEHVPKCLLKLNEITILVGSLRFEPPTVAISRV